MNQTFIQYSKRKGWENLFSHLPKKSRDWLYQPVRDGHAELFRTCCILRQLGVEEVESAAEIIAARWLGYNRMPEPREIEDAWVASEAAYQEEEGDTFTTRAKPRRDQSMIDNVLKGSDVDLKRIKDYSPVPYDILRNSRPAAFLQSLFPRNALICLGQTAARATVSHLATAMGKARRHPLIVPSPMTSTRGRNKKGLLTPRCLDNTGPRKYAVVEFDHGTLDDQSKLISEVAGKFPGRLKMVVWSGGKSLHSWFRVEGDETLSDEIFDFSILLGADPMTRPKCQFVRTPQAMRDEKIRQEVLFYDRD